MSPLVELLAFAGVMALGQFSPGPDMVLLTRTSLAEGARAGVAMALGIAAGLALHAALAVCGVTIILLGSGVVARGLGLLGAGYLFWLALGLFRAAFSKGGEEGVELNPARAGGAFRRGFLCNVLNPKVALVLAAVMAAFLTGERPGWWRAALWGIVVVQGAVLWSLWAGLLQWGPARRCYQRTRRWLDAGFGLALAALGVVLLRSAVS